MICGGESGHERRDLSPEWARLIRDQCVAKGVPFFFKQWGGRTSKSGGRTSTAGPGIRCRPSPRRLRGPRRVLVPGLVGSTVRDPLRVGKPFIRTLSLIVTGTPSRPPTGAPAAPPCLGCPRGGARALRVDELERVQGRLHALDPAEQRLRHVDGRERARAKPREQVDGGEPGDLFGHVRFLRAPILRRSGGRVKARSARARARSAAKNSGDLGTLSPRF